MGVTPWRCVMRETSDLHSSVKMRNRANPKSPVEWKPYGMNNVSYQSNNWCKILVEPEIIVGSSSHVNFLCFMALRGRLHSLVVAPAFSLCFSVWWDVVIVSVLGVNLYLWSSFSKNEHFWPKNDHFMAKNAQFWPKKGVNLEFEGVNL